MSRYLLRLSIAVLSFSIGLSAFWASGYWNRFENFVDRFSSEQNINVSAIELNQFHFVKEIEDTKAVYKEILGTPKGKLFVSRETESVYFDDSFREEELLGILIADKQYHDVENAALIDYLNKAKFTDLLQILPEQTNEIRVLDKEFSTKSRNYDLHTPLYTLSNVGFNLDRTQAFVCVVYEGKGEYIFLKKQNNQWMIADKFPLWGS